jgi:hypothetical protein
MKRISQCRPHSFGSNMGPAVRFVHAAKATGVPQKSEISRLFDRLFGSTTLLHLKEFPDLHITAKASPSRDA